MPYGINTYKIWFYDELDINSLYKYKKLNQKLDFQINNTEQNITFLKLLIDHDHLSYIHEHIKDIKKLKEELKKDIKELKESIKSNNNIIIDTKFYNHYKLSIKDQFMEAIDDNDTNASKQDTIDEIEKNIIKEKEDIEIKEPDEKTHNEKEHDKDLIMLYIEKELLNHNKELNDHIDKELNDHIDKELIKYIDDKIKYNKQRNSNQFKETYKDFSKKYLQSSELKFKKDIKNNTNYLNILNTIINNKLQDIKIDITVHIQPILSSIHIENLHNLFDLLLLLLLLELMDKQEDIQYKKTTLNESIINELTQINDERTENLNKISLALFKSKYTDNTDRFVFFKFYDYYPSILNRLWIETDNVCLCIYPEKKPSLHESYNNNYTLFNKEKSTIASYNSVNKEIIFLPLDVKDSNPDKPEGGPHCLFKQDFVHFKSTLNQKSL
jgi:hypothetical protein